MFIAIGLALISLFLIYLEFFVPGAVLGILGGLGLCLSTLLFVWESGEPWQMVVFIVTWVVLLILTIKLALRKIKQKPAMFAKDEQSGYVASAFNQQLIGKSGEAATDLKPSGHIRIEGERYQAVSENRYIKKGESIKVIGGEGARLIVRKK